MATTYHTVSEEMSRTEWSVAPPRTARNGTADGKPNLAAIGGLALASLIAIAGVIYLLPPG